VPVVGIVIVPIAFYKLVRADRKIEDFRRLFEEKVCDLQIPKLILKLLIAVEESNVSLDDFGVSLHVIEDPDSVTFHPLTGFSLRIDW
jgi:hypothetical protein